LNKTNLGWAEYNWNPVTGCTFGCPYYYARKSAYNLRGKYGYPLNDPFRPTFHPEHLHEPEKLKHGARIFAVGMGDIFDPLVEPEWVSQVFEEMRKCPQHTFLVLTKRAERLKEFDFPNNCMAGVSVDRQSRVGWIDLLRDCKAKMKCVNFEPLLKPVDPNFEGIDKAIVGALHNEDGSYMPLKKEWVRTIIKEARRANCAIFIDDSARAHRHPIG